MIRYKHKLYHRVYQTYRNSLIGQDEKQFIELNFK